MFETERVGFQHARRNPASEKNLNTPRSVEDVNTCGLVLVATEPPHDRMLTFPNLTGTDMDHGEFHAMKLV